MQDHSLFFQNKPRLNDFDVEEKALEAQAILNHPIIKDALNDIYSKAVGTLLTAEVGSLTAGAAHASMKATVELMSQLEQYVVDNKMRQKYSKGDK